MALLFTDVCRVFENGAAYVGSDYLAHILWDKYLKFEQQHGTPAHIMRLYLQILGSPLRDLDRYYARQATLGIRTLLAYFELLCVSALPHYLSRLSCWEDLSHGLFAANI